MQDTIVAPATALGRSSVGIVRISGIATKSLARLHLRKRLIDRVATYCSFFDAVGKKLDQGIALLFCAPCSLTGEDVLEFQGHGSPLLIQKIIEAFLQNPGVRLAKPGEFLKRAFFHGKLDLTQAEAIADVIDADSEMQIEAAQITADGQFGQSIRTVYEQLLSIRGMLEAHIDFLDQPLSHVDMVQTHQNLANLSEIMTSLLKKAQQAVNLRKGFEVVLGGLPNAGKSSLLNRFLSQERALVTQVAGTTRDTIREPCFLEGMPIYLTDTAGIRDSQDLVEQMGIDRSFQALKRASIILWVVDLSDLQQIHNFLQGTSAVPGTANWLKRQFPDTLKYICFNKMDKLTKRAVDGLLLNENVLPGLPVSAQYGEGIDQLKRLIVTGLSESSMQPGQRFLIRERCRDRLQAALIAVQAAKDGMVSDALPLDCIAQELQDAQTNLGEIIGAVNSTELLDTIFGNFCLGK